MAAWATVLAAVLATGAGPDDPVTIHVDASRVLHRVSPWLYGACIEDVNHEIYGGIYSQMIFGESFQEPARPRPAHGLHGLRRAVGRRGRRTRGRRRRRPEARQGQAGVRGRQVGVEVFFEDDRPGNAGLIVKVSGPETGADRFTGYEVSLESGGTLVIGRHRLNWEPIRRVPCPAAPGQWHALVVKLREKGFDVAVDGRAIATIEDVEHPLVRGASACAPGNGPRGSATSGPSGGSRFFQLAFRPADADLSGEGVSGMWRAAKARVGPG